MLCHSSCCSLSSLALCVNRWCFFFSFHSPSFLFIFCVQLIVLVADSHFTNHSLCCPPPSFLLLLLPSSFVTTAGKTTPTSASTTHHGAEFPKEAGDPERGTGPDGPPPAGEQGSPGSEPISVEMEGKGGGIIHVSSFNSDLLAGGLHCWALNVSQYTPDPLTDH